MAARVAMYNGNRLKLGFFGSNCSSGRFVTRAPERWSGNWEDNLRLARMGDEAGIDFILPIGRWKGYAGETDYQGSTFETITWASGLLAQTQRITAFGTVHATLFPPLIAAKQMVTADHIGHGRFGLNLVCGSNEGEFEMFGVTMEDHAARYRQGQEWLDVLRRIWSEDDFDYKGEFFDLKGVREKPKPWGGGRPLIMNAGASGEGRAFALRNCDAWFTSTRLETLQQASLDQASQVVISAKAEARKSGHDIDVYTVGTIICRRTRREAEEFHRYIAEEQADWGAVDNILAGRGLADRTPEEIEAYRRDLANGKGGLMFRGDPDEVAGYLIKLSAAGFRGCGMSFVNYADEFPFFREEVLPRLERAGVREPAKVAA
jgi:alkanesulfonate monooxygenase SsuD/methylene tetrahydromethanopterin reductase-like flavin-dependent oxidoreductase (luciferase family)